MKRVFVLLLVLALAFAALGCSGTDSGNGNGNGDKGESNGNGNGNGEKTGLVEDNFYYSATPSDLLDCFQEIEYTYTTDSLTGPETKENSYRYLGAKNGSTAIEMSLSQHATTYEYWLDSEGEPQRVFVDGNELLDDMEIYEAGKGYSSFTTPFVVVTGHWQLPLVSDMHLESYGWQLVDERTETRNLGAGNVEVSIFAFEGEEDASFYFEIADIDGKNMYINFQVTQPDKPDHDFKVTRLIPRS